MPLALKRIQPNDFDVISDGEIVGRIYRIRGTEAWRWTVRLDEPTERHSAPVWLSYSPPYKVIIGGRPR
jgi:hypothetical protein